jgi:hypothetical protein
MGDIVHPSQIYPALQALLGLPDHCVSFELRAQQGEYGVIVACEHYLALDAPGLKQLESVLSEYQLVHREQHPVKVEDFDAWMRGRTDRAHAEYMAGHAAGGIDYSKRYARGGFVDGFRLVGEAA